MEALARWLGEQVDEDERIAWEAGGKYESGQRWWELAQPGNDGTVGDERGSVVVYSTGAGRQHSAHIVRHDPARVLREIAAKRQRIAIHTGPHECASYDWVSKEINTCQWVEQHEACTTLRLEAAPYEDRPGYRQEWRP